MKKNNSNIEVFISKATSVPFIRKKFNLKIFKFLLLNRQKSLENDKPGFVGSCSSEKYA